MDVQQSPQNAPKDCWQIAIETIGQTGSVAILHGSNVVREQKLDTGTRTAASLAPAIDRFFKWCRDSKVQPDFISVASGPGSFTGLRIGVTTAKTLSYATQTRLVAVDSLAAIAATTFAQDKNLPTITVGLNAYRGQVFTANFKTDALLETESRIVDGETWNQTLASLPKDRIVTGDEKIFSNSENFLHRDHADAVGVGLVAVQQAAMGNWSDPMQLVPNYLKPSAAEEQAAK